MMKKGRALSEILQERIVAPRKAGGGSLEYEVSGKCLSGGGGSFPVYDGIPSFIEPDESYVGQGWNPWRVDSTKMMENSYYRIAKGELPEKEASKSYARFLKDNELYHPGNTILDFGCASGHFLRSLRGILDEEVLYTGIDSNYQALQWGAEVYGVSEQVNFLHADVLDIPLCDEAFDISLVNLFHFFPHLDEALREALRVTKDVLIWRTPIGITNYVIKITHMEHGLEELGVLAPERNDFDYYVYMLYSKSYIEELVESLGAHVSLFERDTDFGHFDNTKLPEFSKVPSTRVVGEMQLCGNLHLDWHYVVIKK